MYSNCSFFLLFFFLLSLNSSKLKNKKLRGLKRKKKKILIENIFITQIGNYRFYYNLNFFSCYFSVSKKKKAVLKFLVALSSASLNILRGCSWGKKMAYIKRTKNLLQKFPSFFSFSYFFSENFFMFYVFSFLLDFFLLFFFVHLNKGRRSM